LEPSSPPWRVIDAPAAPAQEDSAPDERLGAPFALVAIGLLVAAGLVVGAVVLASDGRSGSAVEVVAADPDGGSRDGGVIVVQVSGAVARPGLYRMPADARVADAISAAGGFGPRVAADRAAAELDLAARLSDGDRVSVPSRDEAAEATATDPADAGGLIDLNRASAAELEGLPGIGPVTAARIVDARAEQAFASVDELRVRGLVGEKTFGAIRELVTVR